MTIKLIFDPADGRILGAQVIGGAGVDKRIDVLATAIQGQMNVFDLEEMELAYAPQFGAAKDPVNMAGFVAAGVMRGDHPQIGVESLDGDERTFILDVRSREEFTAGAIPGATNLPIDELRARVDEVPRNRRVIAYCQVGQRGYLVTRILLQAGYEVVNLSGGYQTFKMYSSASSGKRIQ
jgi:rhodanese-related sulfurtransferase